MSTASFDIVKTQPEPGGRYTVHCYSCREPFDAMESVWCACLTSERTLVCASCTRCFCKSTPNYKQAFWREAPATLRERAREERAPGSALPKGAVAEAAPGRPLVLLVDDEPDIIRTASLVIRSLGFGLLVARDGEEGLALARAHRPDVVLTDALMPRLDGREMCRQIKGSPECAGTRVIVMTGLYTSVKYQTEGHKVYKADAFIAKPLALDELLSLLEKHAEIQ
jgi:CheY-like chemotaxis protein